MTLHGELVLADDVLMRPAEDVAAHAGDGRLAFEPGDHVIGRAGSRTPAKLIDARAASLLEQFRAPRRVVEAIVTHSRDGGHDPQSTLEEALPLIQHFVAVGFLVPGDSDDARKIAFSLEPGDRAGDFEIVDRIQALEDTEVYRAQRGDDLVAVKLGRGPAGERAVANERRILERLDGTVDPGFVAAGRAGDRPFVATRWRAGASAAVAALQARDRGDLELAAALSVSVLEAYAHLHAQGVVHADVHPDNLVVAPDGAVTILDFGLARHVADTGGALPPRGGVGGFADPGYAAARRRGFEPPPATFADEQYSLGVLVYALVTGRPYLDLSLVEEDMIRQVLDDDPVPFADRGLEWPRVEAVLGRSLRKEARDRYADVRTFANELRGAVSTPPRTLVATHSSDASDELLDGLADPEAAELALAGGMWECSVNTGAAGVAYALHRLALLRDSPDLAAAAEVWARHARRHAEAAAARDDLSDELPPGARLDLSLFHRDPGIHCVLALVADARGDRTTYDEAVKGFLRAIEPELRDVDLTLGRAGALLGCAHLLPTAAPGSDAARLLLAAGERQRDAIWSQLRDQPTSGDDRIAYLGIAHGWGGIVYATLSWHLVAGGPVAPDVTERLDELADLGEPAGAGAMRWPRLAPPLRSDYWTGWCNGAAGLAQLWELAGTLLDRSDYLDLAERAATAGAEMRAGGDLCCGSAGAAYALLRVHRRTNDPGSLATARRLVDHATATVGRERPRALYKGGLGVALLRAELDADPGAARMPLFEVEAGR